MKFDRYITIQSLAYTQDTMGQAVNTWTTFMQCNASKLDKSGTEEMENARNMATRTTVWKIRYNPNKIPLEKMRILYRSRYYDIEIVKELGRFEGFELTTISKDARD